MDFINAIVLLSNFVIVPALSYGSQLALGAIGVTLIYGILRFANFAYGDLMAFGTMFAILFTWYFQSIGISLGVLPTALLAIPFGVIITILYCINKTQKEEEVLQHAQESALPAATGLGSRSHADLDLSGACNCVSYNWTQPDG